MVDSTSRWDTQGLGFGLAFGLLGLVFLVARDDGSLRPVHLLGVVVLAVGGALLLSAVDRSWPDMDRAERRGDPTSDRPEVSDPLELP